MKKLGIVLDDGWRYEKRELLEFLKGKIDFDVLTHDPDTKSRLEPDFPVVLVETQSLKSSWEYRWRMFFARDLESQTVRTFNEYRFHKKGPLHRLLFRLRNGLGRLGLRRLTYCQTLEKLYRNSSMHTDLLSGYDRILFSPVGVLDKRILFEAKRLGIPRIAWVFSWDNPMKDNEFPADADRYFAWNEESAKDLGLYHGIPRDRVEITGPVQFDFYLEERKNPPPPAEEPYVLFACTMGIEPYLGQEIRLVLHLREILDQVNPDMKLMVRPYPFLDDPHAYRELEAHLGIGLFTYGSYENKRTVIGPEDLVDKYRQMAQATCFVNFGSTIILEASFTDTPILQMTYALPWDGPWWSSLEELLTNDHLKYTLSIEAPNRVDDGEALRKGLEDILSGNLEPYRGFTEKLQAFANPLDGVSYKEEFLKALKVG